MMYGEMLSHDADRSGWEMSKENIQPLSSGRKVSILCHSLDKADEAEVAKHQKQLEEHIKFYDGDDPLEPWLKYITFLEQTCPTGGKGNAAYEGAVNNCVKTFMVHPRYKNDRRFVDVYIKAINSFAPSRRAQLLQGMLDKGFGSTVSRMYMVIADDLEASDNTNGASSVLKKGIAAGAEPVEYLHDALANLETRVVQKLSRSMSMNPGENDMARNFGSSVPVCKITQEAQNIRVALSPGNPCRARPLARQQVEKRQTVKVFEGDDASDAENKMASSIPTLALPSKQVELVRKEQENSSKPKKWVNQMLPPTLPLETETREPIQIFVEEPNNQPVAVSRVAKGVLVERKPSCEDFKPSAVLFNSTSSMYRKSQLNLPNGRQITFEHLRANEYLRKLDAKSITELEPIVLDESNCSSKVMESSGRNSNASSRCVNSSVSVTTLSSNPIDPVAKLAEEIQFLKVKVEEQDITINTLKQRDAERIQQIQTQQSHLQAAEHAYADLQQVYFQLEQKCKQELSELKQSFRQEKVGLLNQIHSMESEVYSLKQSNEELLKSIELENLRSTNLLQENEQLRQSWQTRYVEAPIKNVTSNGGASENQDVFLRPKPFGGNTLPLPAYSGANLGHSTGTLGFDLYESRLGDNTVNLALPSVVARSNTLPTQINNNSENIPQYPKPLSVQAEAEDHFVMPPPPPRSSVPILEENKENVAQDDNIPFKLARHHEGILVPSSSAEPMEMIFTEDDDDTEAVVQRQSDTGGDFNVTDLTRALEFHPTPLINSTPEKHKTGFLPIPSFQAVKKRKPFVQLDEFATSSDSREQEIKESMKEGPVLQIYEDDNNYQNPRENSTNPHVYGNSIALVLSPIAEASKERWSSCTSSSSSTNTTTTRGGGTFSVGSSYSSNTKSALWKTQTPQYSSRTHLQGTTEKCQDSRSNLLNNSEY